MAQDFPNNPTLGQVFGSYVWNGTAWTGIGSANNLGVQVGGIIAREAYDYHPNYLINSAFDFWQRGTTITAGGYTWAADRWKIVRGATVAGMTVSQQPASLPGIRYCARIQRDSGNTSTNGLAIWQVMETQNSVPLAGKTVTVSFYARAGANYSPTNKNLSVSIHTGTGVDDSSNGMSWGWAGGANVLSTKQITTSWERYTFTATIPSTALQAGVAFDINPVGTAGAADYVEITGVQLEEGAVATPFHRNSPSIQGELAACQRYYERSYNLGVAVGTGTNDGNISFRTTNNTSSTMTIAQSWYFKVSKRATPTIRTYATYTGTVDKINVNSTEFNTNIYGASQNGASAYIGGTIPSNSDITWQWTADAEL